jgi:hypothetical protein
VPEGRDERAVGGADADVVAVGGEPRQNAVMASSQMPPMVMRRASGFERAFQNPSANPLPPAATLVEPRRSAAAIMRAPWLTWLQWPRTLPSSPRRVVLEPGSSIRWRGVLVTARGVLEHRFHTGCTGARAAPRAASRSRARRRRSASASTMPAREARPGAPRAGPPSSTPRPRSRVAPAAGLVVGVAAGDLEPASPSSGATAS